MTALIHMLRPAHAPKPIGDDAFVSRLRRIEAERMALALRQKTLRLRAA